MTGSGLGCAPKEPEAAQVRSPDLENSLAESWKRLADFGITQELQ
jgi:hypothetical protein